MTVPQQMLDDILDYVEVSSRTVKMSLDENSVHRAAQKRAAELRPDLLQLMLQHGAVAQSRVKEAEAMLASHPETLQLLKAAVVKNAEYKTELSRLKEAGRLGGPDAGRDATKAAAEARRGPSFVPPGGEGYDSLNDAFVGRRTSEKKASDFAILQVLENPPGR